MHHLPSLRNSFNACDVLLAAAGEKTGCFFSAKIAQYVRRGEVAGCPRSPVALIQKIQAPPPLPTLSTEYHNNLLQSPPPFSFCNGLWQPFSWGWSLVYPKTSQEQDYVKYPPHYSKQQNSHQEELLSHKNSQ
jgi:hypothetical protein